MYFEARAVEAGVGEVSEPVAEHEHLGGGGELAACHHVQVSEEEIAGVGVVGQVCVAEGLQAAQGHLGAFGAGAELWLLSRGGAPAQCEGDGPSGIDGGVEVLAEAVAEEPLHEAEGARVAAGAVAVRHIEGDAVDFFCQLGVHHPHAEFFLDIVEEPDVVVAGQPCHLHAGVGELGELAEQAHVALWHHVLVFVPVVEDVAEQVYGHGLLLDAVEEGDDASFALAGTVVVGGAQVKVAQEVGQGALSHFLYGIDVVVDLGGFHERLGGHLGEDLEEELLDFGHGGCGLHLEHDGLYVVVGDAADGRLGGAEYARTEDFL